MKLTAEMNVRLLVDGVPKAVLWVVMEGPLKNHFVWPKCGIRVGPAPSRDFLQPGNVVVGNHGRGSVTEVDVKGVPAPGPGNFELLPDGFKHAERLVACEDGTWGMATLSIGDVLELVHGSEAAASPPVDVATPYTRRKIQVFRT